MIYSNFILLILTVTSVFADNLLKSQFPLYGITEVAIRAYEKEKTQCREQLMSIYNGVRKHESWALKLFDASGSPGGGGFIWGNDYWLGRYSQCRWLSSRKETVLPPSSESSVEYQPFSVSFYVALFKQTPGNIQTDMEISSEKLTHLGLCLPSSCSSEDLEPLLAVWAAENPLAVQSLYNFTLEFQSIRSITRNLSWIYSPLALTIILVITIASLLTISGTVYDIYVWSPIKKNKQANNIEWKNNQKAQDVFKARNIRDCSEPLNCDNNLNEYYEVKIDNSQHKSMPIHVMKTVPTPSAHEPEQNALAKLSLCFSAKSNIGLFAEIPAKTNDLSIIHGLRFVGMIWLVWLYTVHYIKTYSDSGESVRADRFSDAYQTTPASAFAVDIFFFASGFTIVYKYYKDRCKSLKTERNFSVKKKVNEFSFMALHRFLRLTPIYLIILGLVVISVTIIRGTSLFEMTETADELCQKTWWRNIAYINNLFGESEMCVSWSWYLSADMQFFLLGLFIVTMSTRFWAFFAVLSTILIVLSSLITGYYGHRFASTARSPEAKLYSDILNYSPWTRVGPYLIGTFTGYFIVHLKGELVLKRSTLVTCWAVATVCSAWALFGLYLNTSTISATLHTALSRCAWTLAISWIVIACSTGNAEILKSVLSFSLWTRLNKLFYPAYLLGPLVVISLVSNAETAIHLDFLQRVVYFVASACLIYLGAFLLSITIEIPLTVLRKQTIGGRRQIQNQLNQFS